MSELCPYKKGDFRHTDTQTHTETTTEREGRDGGLPLQAKGKTDTLPAPRSCKGKGLERIVLTPGFQPSGLQNSEKLTSVA